jgi:hypothetical protein
LNGSFVGETKVELKHNRTFVTLYKDWTHRLDSNTDNVLLCQSVGKPINGKSLI